MTLSRGHPSASSLDGFSPNFDLQRQPVEQAEFFLGVVLKGAEQDIGGLNPIFMDYLSG